MELAPIEPRTIGRTAGPGLHLLSRTISFGDAMLIHLTGRPIAAARAYEMGLVQGVHDSRGAMLDAARAIVAATAECSVEAVRMIKRIVRTSREVTVDQSEAVQLAVEQARFDRHSLRD